MNRKKNILLETKKQLESPKKNLTIILSKDYRIKKKCPWASVEHNLHAYMHESSKSKKQ